MNVSNASGIWLLRRGEDPLCILNAFKKVDDVYEQNLKARILTHSMRRAL